MPRSIPMKFLAFYEFLGVLAIGAAVYVLASIYWATNHSANYSVVVYTNLFGENFGEVVFLVATLPAVVLVLSREVWFLLKPTYEGWRKRRAERLARQAGQSRK